MENDRIAEAIANRDKKKERSRNFTQDERHLLVTLMKKDLKVFENKLIDGVTVRAKEQSWLKVKAEFNNHPNVKPRTICQLRDCYRNMKKKIKKTSSSQSAGPAEDRLIQYIAEEVGITTSENEFSHETQLEHSNQNNTDNSDCERIPRNVYDVALIDQVQNSSTSFSDEQDLALSSVETILGDPQPIVKTITNNNIISNGISSPKLIRNVPRKVIPVSSWAKRRAAILKRAPPTSKAPPSFPTAAETATVKMLQTKIKLTNEQRKREREEHELKMEVLQAKLDFYIRATEKLEIRENGLLNNGLL